MSDSKNRYVVLMLIAVVGVVLLIVFMQPRDDTPMERMENAAEEMTDGMEDAARELDPDRTTGEKIGDAVEDMGEDIQDAAE